MTVVQLIRKCIAFYGIPLFIVMITKALIPNLNRMNSVHIAKSYFPNIYFNLSSYIRLGVPRDLMPSGSSTLHISHFFHDCNKSPSFCTYTIFSKYT
jgi:hypothetical protein